MTDQPTAGVALKHLELAEQIIAALQESVPAMDSYDEDEIAALETEIATIALPFLRTPASGPVEADDRLAVAVRRIEVLRDQARNGTPVTDPNEWEADELDAILALLTKSGEASQ